MKIKCFVHTDLDGVGCVILAYLAFGRENVDVEYCDYSNIDETVRAFCETGLYRIYDHVYITDISISEDTADYIQSECSKYMRELNWHLFDHHTTALGLNKYDWCDVKVNAPVDSYFKTCGTELFAIYLHEGGAFDHHGSYVINNIDRFVGIVRDYDTWRWKDRGKEGVICKQVNDLFYIYGRDKFIRWASNQIYTYREPRTVDFDGESLVVLESEGYSFPWFSEMDRTLLEQKQKDIDIYVEEKNKQLAQKIDEFGHMYGVVFAERYFSELGNRLCEMNPEIAYVAIIDICNGKIHYRTIRDDIDVGGEIARSRGGGGHKKAARSEFDGKFIMAMVVNKATRGNEDENETEDTDTRKAYIAIRSAILPTDIACMQLGVYSNLSKAAWAIREDVKRMNQANNWSDANIPSGKNIMFNMGVFIDIDKNHSIVYRITECDVK